MLLGTLWGIQIDHWEASCDYPMMGVTCVDVCLSFLLSHQPEGILKVWVRKRARRTAYEKSLEREARAGRREIPPTDGNASRASFLFLF